VDAIHPDMDFGENADFAEKAEKNNIIFYLNQTVIIMEVLATKKQLKPIIFQWFRLDS
jgi:acetyl/propionyl-CoA carboxylase alpha subunit